MESSTLILALDQGTTSSRAILFDASGSVVSKAQKEFRQYYPKPGWVEHDPEEIWKSQQEVIHEAIQRANIKPGRIAAIGITNQRETTVVWDRNSGKAIYPAIVWQDRRTSSICRTLKEQGLESKFREKTGLLMDPYFSGTKISWILDNISGARDRAKRGELCFGTVDTWLMWKLSRGKLHVTDVTNASRTLLMNVDTGEWDQQLLEILGIPMSMLPEIHESSERYGHSEHDGCLPRVPVCGIAGDQHAALFGQACFKPGMAKNTYGTGCFMLMNTGTSRSHSKNQLLSTVAWKINGITEYAFEGSIFTAGAAVQWLRDELQVIKTAEECDRLAESVPDSNGLFLVPAFTGLGAPHWDPLARGMAIGITRGTNRAHLCRAVLESIAFQSADLISAMQKDSGLPITELRVDGGASRSNPLMQFQADLLQVPVIRPQCTETTALGAAYLAGLGAGIWNSREEISQNWVQERLYEPSADADSVKTMQKGWARAVERAKNWELES